MAEGTGLEPASPFGRRFSRPLHYQLCDPSEASRTIPYSLGKQKAVGRKQKAGSVSSPPFRAARSVRTRRPRSQEHASLWERTHCPLPTAHCPLPTAACPPPTPHSPPPTPHPPPPTPHPPRPRLHSLTH